MHLTNQEEQMLRGEEGPAAQKSMEILVALGTIFDADRMVEIKSAQVAGVSYHNIGDAGLEYLEDIARMEARVRVLTTLNPAGMDLENWPALGISPEFAERQARIIRTFEKMGVMPSCTCTPYLVGNLPVFNDHLAWSESSAVAFANSVIGARTNREGGPGALAAAIAGRTPNYGMHKDENRTARVLVKVNTTLDSIPEFGALGYAIGKKIEDKVSLIRCERRPTLEELKSLCASIATYGGAALFHVESVTPNPSGNPSETLEIQRRDIEQALTSLSDDDGDVDFVALGCPHCSLEELRSIAELLNGKHVRTEFWICVARPIRQMAETLGYTRTIEAAGGKFACDTCMAVAPLRGRFRVLATDSAKACYYARGSNSFKTKIGTLEQCVEAAVTGKWN